MKTPRVARPNVIYRNGWQWRCLNAWGELVEGTPQGRERSKTAAQEAAQRACKEYNAAYVAPVEAKRPRVAPTCAKSGEYNEVFERHENRT